MQAFFLPAASGQRFCLFHAPPQNQPTLGGLVYIHPFAEEMNRSRAVAAQQARAFANAGYAVIQIDLAGCGDSSGDFASATWAAWLQDVQLARQWLAARIPGEPWLWGLRAGCFLAAGVAQVTPDEPANLLLWQPILSGRQHLNQFLRLKFASDLVQGVAGGGTESLAHQLSAGQTVEVVGYTLSPELAQGLERSDLEAIPRGSRVASFELSGSAQAGLSPALTAQLLRWNSKGCLATGACIAGPAFWQSTEVEPSPDLIKASLDAVLWVPD